jgi:hypothetical protein
MLATILYFYGTGITFQERVLYIITGGQISNLIGELNSDLRWILLE